MKRLSVLMAIFLSFIMMFSLTACNNEDLSSELDTAYQKIDELNEKIDELNHNIKDISESLGDNSTKYTVKFITSGTVISDMKTNLISYSPTSIKDNFVLEGWFFDAYATRPVSFPLSVNCDMTLYAKFKETRESLADRFDKYVSSLEDEKLQNDIAIAGLQKEIAQLENRKEKRDTTEDVDVMMTKIHTTDVDSSAVDETMESIKRGEKLFKQYSFGVANKETVKMFETFIHNMYEQAPLIGRFYILNNPFNCMGGLDKDACASLLQHLIQERIVETRGEEYISQYLEEDVIKEITKEC